MTNFFKGITDPLNFSNGNLGKAKPDAPPSLDIVGAARETGQQNIENTRLQASMNRPNETNAYGSRTWTQGPNDTWSVNTSLAPEEQAKLDRNRQLQAALGGIAQGNVGNMQNMFSTPLTANESDRKSTEDAIYSRMNPQFDRDESAMRTRLANQGISQGSEAYNNEVDSFNRSKNDMRQQAVLAGGQEQSRLFNLGAQSRNQALSEFGQLAGNPDVPQFQAYGGVGAAAAPDLAGATSAQNSANIGFWNAQQAQQQQMRSGLMGLGGAAMAAFM